MRWSLRVALFTIQFFVFNSALEAQSLVNNDLFELTERRTKNSKTFVDSKGQYHLKQTNGAFHYLNSYGKWTDIQRSISSDIRQENLFGLFDSDLPISVNGITGRTEMTMNGQSEQLVFGESGIIEFIDKNFAEVQSINKQVVTEITQEDNSLLLKDFYTGIDRIQYIDYGVVQTDFKINERPVLPSNTKYLVFKDFYELPSAWRIEYAEGQRLANGWQGSLNIVDEEGSVVAQISIPKFYDSYIRKEKKEKGRHGELGSYVVNRLSDSKYEISILVDADWLLSSELVYPVTIDPTISLNYVAAQGLQDWISQFNANCQASLQIALPAGNAISVTNSSFQYTIRSKGYVGSTGWTDYFAAGMEQRSRIYCGANQTPIQSGYGNSISPQNIPYNISSSNIANGCYPGGTVLTYLWRGYNTYFPDNWGPASANVYGCVTNYQELLANTWVVTVTYTDVAITANANPSVQSICSGQNAIIQLTGTPNNVAYSWTASNNGTSGATNGSGPLINQPLSSSTNGTATYTITPTSNGCQGTPITASVNVVASTTTDVYEQFCSGTTFSFAGNSYSQPGNYQITLQSAAGCDSIVILHLQQVQSLSSTINQQVCNGGSYSIGSNTYTSTGTYTNMLQSSAGCDSLVTLNLTVLPTYGSSFSASICQGSSYSFNGNNYSVAGVYNITLQSATGCDSIVSLSLTVNPVLGSSIQAQICSGNSYPFNGNNYNASGSYSMTLQTANGCDSVVTLHLTVTNVLTSTRNEQICQGNSYTFNNTSYSSSGSFNVMLQTAQGCDSIATLNLTVNPNYQVYINQGVCTGQSYLFHGNTYNSAGAYQAHLITSKGCDSIVNLNLSLHPLPTVDIGSQYDLCYGQSKTLRNTGSIGNYLWSNGSTDSQIDVSSTGTYWLKVTSAAGCTASDTCSVIARSSPIKPDSMYFELCGGEVRYLNAGNAGSNYLWSDNRTEQVIAVNKGGEYGVLITNQFGCTRYESFLVREFCEPSIFVPSAFTPDNDGLNDYFKVEGENIGSFEMVIYNRWGQPVFESADFNNGWNGAVNGGDYYAQDGLYHWVVRYKTILDITGIQSDWKSLKGYVTVVR